MESTKLVDVSAECIMAGDSIVHPLTSQPAKVHHVDRFPGKDSVRINFTGDTPAVWVDSVSLVTIRI
jgi:hypothetical protein